VRMDKALMMVVGGLLTVFALVPDQRGQSASTAAAENLSTSTVVPDAVQTPQAQQMPVPTDSVYSSTPVPMSVQPTNSLAGNGNNQSQREAQGATAAAPEITQPEDIH